jgi:hypothetical protein
LKNLLQIEFIFMGKRLSEAKGGPGSFNGQPCAHIVVHRFNAFSVGKFFFDGLTHGSSAQERV